MKAVASLGFCQVGFFYSDHDDTEDAVIIYIGVLRRGQSLASGLSIFCVKTLWNLLTELSDFFRIKPWNDLPANFDPLNFKIKPKFVLHVAMTENLTPE